MATISVTKCQNHRKVFVLALVGLLALGGLFVVSTAVASSFSWANVTTFDSGPGQRIPADQREVKGSAILVRSEHGITIDVHTTDLTPGYAYTNWWIIFNNPSECGAAGCGGSDLSNPKVEGSVLYATGRVACDDAPKRMAAGCKTKFSAFLPVGLVRLNRTVEGRERHRLGPGLQNVWKAEIHYIIRNHGPAGPSTETLVEELSTFGGSCDSFDCFDPQTIGFPLPHD